MHQSLNNVIVSVILILGSYTGDGIPEDESVHHKKALLPGFSVGPWNTMPLQWYGEKHLDTGIGDSSTYKCMHQNIIINIMQLVFCRRAIFYEHCSDVAVVSVSTTHGLVHVCLVDSTSKVRNCTCSGGSNDNVFVCTTGWFMVLRVPECWCHNTSIFVDLLAWETLVFLTSRFEAILITYYTSTYLLD